MRVQKQKNIIQGRNSNKEVIVRDISRFPSAKLPELAITPDGKLKDKFPQYSRDDLRNLKKETIMENQRRITEGESVKDNLYALLLKGRRDWTLEALSDELNVGVGRIRSALKELNDEGKNIQPIGESIQLSKDIPSTKPSIIPVNFSEGTWYKFGAVSDNHLGSKYERLDVLNALYDRFAEEGITTVYNAGNMIDGEAKFNRFDIHKHGVEEQVGYLVDMYPQRPGITTEFITGDDHEGWYTQREGIDVGRYITAKATEEGRKDLKYLGHMEHDIVFKTPLGQCVLRIVHPGGGSSYATSYTAQKIVESYQEGEKPHILLVGHYHKAEYTFARGVHIVQTGCTEDQTPFMRKKRLAAHLGGWIIEFQQGETGAIQRFRAEFIPFFDRGYYEKAWKFR